MKRSPGQMPEPTAEEQVAWEAESAAANEAAAIDAHEKAGREAAENGDENEDCPFCGIQYCDCSD